MTKCVLYSTGCPKCRVLQAKLDNKGIDYMIINEENVVIDTCKNAGADSLPLLEVEGEYLNFNEAIRWVGEQN